MLLLSISTSTATASVAIGRDGSTLARAALGVPTSHDEFLTPAIEFCARQAGIGMSQLSGVVVDHGPGLFTGLRVGISTAKAIAVTLGVPMLGISSLDLLALNARHTRREICATLDARRGEIYSAFYRPVHGGVVCTSEFMLLSPDALADELVARSEDVLVVGDGALLHADAFSHVSGIAIAEDFLAHPSAETAFGIGCDHFEKEEFIAPHEIEPVYLRKSDAELNWESQREAREAKVQRI